MGVQCLPHSSDYRLLATALEAQRLDTGSGAGKDEADIAPARDELKALFGAADHLFRAAAREAGDFAGVPARLNDLLQGAGMAVIVRGVARVDTHGQGEVRRARPAAVDAGDREDRLGVLHRVD